MTNEMTNEQIRAFFGMSKNQLIAVFEAAKIALADAEIAEEVGATMSMGDYEINRLQNKVHELLENNPNFS